MPAVVGARHAGSGEIDAILLQGWDGLGIYDRHELHGDAEPLGNLGRKINVVADDLAALARRERRRGLAVADQKLATRLDVVELVGGRDPGGAEQNSGAQEQFGRSLHGLLPVGWPLL